MKHTDATVYGSWKVTFRYSEMKGNIGKKSGCQGVFPYAYSQLYEIYQVKGFPDYMACRMPGADCVGRADVMSLLFHHKNE